MKVLIADDDVQNRYFLEVLLKAHGHDVVNAENGLAALAILRREPIDLIISDILMPRMDGYQLCRACKQDERLRNIPFVLLTAMYTDEKDEALAHGAGADGFVRRPIEPDALMEIIGEVVSKRRQTASPLQSEAYLQEYAARVVNKLEEKVADLENEIAARTRAEAALRESEEKFRGFAEAADEVFWITAREPEERVIYVNRSFEHVWGRTVDALYANPRLWIDAIHPDDQPTVIHSFSNWTEAKPDARYDVEYRIIRPDGRTRWISDRGFLIHDKDGSTRLAGIADDITERKEADEALRESEERYRSLVSALAEGVILMDDKGVIRAVNPSAERMLGFATDQMIGHTPFDPRWRSVQEDGTPFTVQTDPNWVTLKTGEPCRDVVMGIRKRDGFLAWLSVNTQPLYRRGEKKPYSVVASFIDITERKLFERELERQARTDPLTGTANRRYFMELAEKEIGLSRRYRHPLSLLMLDFDHFKQVNDAYGHQGGDLALQTLARVCQRTLRDVDTFGRLGGEEFAILLAETGPERARSAAERLRQAISMTDVAVGPDKTVRFTVSIGVATLGGVDTSIDALIRRADLALYEAKRTGRNRVCVATTVAEMAISPGGER